MDEDEKIEMIGELKYKEFDIQVGLKEDENSKKSVYIYGKVFGVDFEGTLQEYAEELFYSYDIDKLVNFALMHQIEMAKLEYYDKVDDKICDEYYNILSDVSEELSRDYYPKIFDKDKFDDEDIYCLLSGLYDNNLYVGNQNLEFELINELSENQKIELLTWVAPDYESTEMILLSMDKETFEALKILSMTKNDKEIIEITQKLGDDDLLAKFIRYFTFDNLPHVDEFVAREINDVKMLNKKCNDLVSANSEDLNEKINFCGKVEKIYNDMMQEKNTPESKVSTIVSQEEKISEQEDKIAELESKIKEAEKGKNKSEV